MASNLDALQNLPEIDFLSDLNITQETIAEEMLEDYQSKYEELIGKEITLYPATICIFNLSVLAGYNVISFPISSSYLL